MRAYECVRVWRGAALLRLLTRDLYLSKVADLDSRSGLSRGPDGLVVGFRRFGIAR